MPIMASGEDGVRAGLGVFLGFLCISSFLFYTLVTEDALCLGTGDGSKWPCPIDSGDDGDKVGLCVSLALPCTLVTKDAL